MAKGSAVIAATVWAGLEKCAYFRAQSEALSVHISEDAGRAVRHAVPDDGDELLREAFVSAGFQDVEIELVEAMVELPPVEGYATAQLAGTPWAEAFAAANLTEQKSFGLQMAEVLSRYEVPGGGAAVPFASYLAVGRKS